MPKNFKAESDKIKAARKARNVAASRKKTSTSSSTKKSTASKTKSTVNTTSITHTSPTVKQIQPGVDTITPDTVSASLPQFNPSDYEISNPLQPPQSLPQVSELDFESGMSTYQGAVRALKLTGIAFDVVGERYVTEGKKAKAYGAGLDAGIEFEKVKAKHYKYLTQVENTTQAESNYGLAVKRTGVVEQTNQYAESELEETLEKSRIKAATAKLQRQSAENKLAELQKQLGEVAN